MSEYKYPPKLFETDRLVLRQPVKEDASAIFEEYAQDREVSRYLTWKPHKSIKETRAFLFRCEKVWREGTSFPWSVIRKTDRQLMGMIEISFEQNGAILGFVLARKYWGNGFIPEAVKTLIKWCLKQDELHRVWAFCDIENSASARAMQKAGMSREGILRSWTRLPQMGDLPRDCISFSAVKADIS